MRVAHIPVAFAAILALACSDSIGPPAGRPPPATGALAITVVTSGAIINLDPDGYIISIDGGAALPIAVSGAMTIANLPTGNHVVLLAGLAPNCAVSGTNPRSARVIEGGVATLVAFDVACGDVPVGGECTEWYYCYYSSQIDWAIEITHAVSTNGRLFKSPRRL